MNTIKTVYENYKMIVLFMGITLVFSLAFGDKTAEHMVLLVLLSIVLLNADEFSQFIKRFNA